MKEQIRTYFKSYIMSVYAGVFISIMCVMLLAVNANDLYGFRQLFSAVLFSAGIIVCMTYKTPLVTGVFPTFKAKNKYFLRVFIAAAGNFTGTLLMRALMIGYPFFEVIKNPVIHKFTPYTFMTSSIVCGLIIGLIVLQKERWVALLLVPVFILCGFQHIVVNMFFLPAWWQILLCFIGNWAGGVLSGFLYKKEE